MSAMYAIGDMLTKMVATMAQSRSVLKPRRRNTADLLSEDFCGWDSTCERMQNLARDGGNPFPKIYWIGLRNLFPRVGFVGK